MAQIAKWGEYVWTRLRRLDYWNPAHIITNLPATEFRAKAPGALAVNAVITRKEEENIFSVRYLHRDTRRRDVGYYPDTPLSLNHNLMKGKPIRPSDAAASQLPVVGSFGAAEYATPGAMGVREVEPGTVAKRLGVE